MDNKPLFSPREVIEYDLGRLALNNLDSRDNQRITTYAICFMMAQTDILYISWSSCDNFAHRGTFLDYMKRHNG